MGVDVDKGVSTRMVDDLVAALGWSRDRQEPTCRIAAFGEATEPAEGQSCAGLEEP